MSKILAWPLSDGRLQIWAIRRPDGLSTCWKETTDPNAAWTPWQDHKGAPPFTLEVRSAATLANGALQLFVGAAGPGPVGGGFLLTTWKVSGESTAQWSDWQGLSMDDTTPPNEALTDFSAGSLTDGRIQVFAPTTFGPNRERFLTRWQQGVNEPMSWSRTTDFAPFRSADSVTAIHLSDGRLQLIAGSDNGLMTTWKLDTQSSGPWQPWQPFAPFYNTSGGGAKVHWGRLSDGRPQLFALDRFGSLKTSWKATTESWSAWTAWVPFEGAPTNVKSFSAAPLSDGRLQLWAVDDRRRCFSTWKANTNPNSAWVPWQGFAMP